MYILRSGKSPFLRATLTISMDMFHSLEGIFPLCVAYQCPSSCRDLVASSKPPQWNSTMLPKVLMVILMDFNGDFMGFDWDLPSGERLH